MTNLEIQALVKKKIDRLVEIFSNPTFVLSKEAGQLEGEIEELQAQCSHEFVDGECKYCGKPEVV